MFRRIAQPMHCLRWGAILYGLALLAPAPTRAIDDQPPPPRIVEQAIVLVEQNFFDVTALQTREWFGARTRAMAQALQVSSRHELEQTINKALDALHTSHTHLYTPDDPRYYELLDIFDRGSFSKQVRRVFPNSPVTYTTIGAVLRTQGNSTFIAEVLPGSPAAKAGLLRGDRIFAVNGQPVQTRQSLHPRAAQPLILTIQRTPDNNDLRRINVTPISIRPRDLFMRALRSSARVMEYEGHRIAYVRVYSYADRDYQDALSQLLGGELSVADGLVLDIRGGWGGADPAYLNLFNPRVPVLTMIDREGDPSAYDPQWRKPVVLLVDRGTRSGKEVLAYAFKTYAIGPVVGSRTAGAVVAGKPFLLDDDSLLLIAVEDVRVDDVRLEGVGVTPDIAVAPSGPYAAGADPQLDAALRTLGERLDGSD